MSMIDRHEIIVYSLHNTIHQNTLVIDDHNIIVC